MRGRHGMVLFAAAGALLLLTIAYLWLLGGTTPRAVPAIGGPFTLMEDNGKTVTDRDFRGRYLLIYFGYTSCPDICPTTLTAIADAAGILGSRARLLQPLFITVDPERDTPAVLHDYVRAFGGSIVGLTGTPAQIHAVERAYRISSAVHPTAPGNYTVDHTAVLFLVAPDGRYLAPLAADESGADMARRLAHEMNR
jgi:protein SCO1